MKPIGWVLPQPDWEPYKKRSLGCDMHRGKCGLAMVHEHSQAGRKAPRYTGSQASSLLSHKETHFCCVLPGLWCSVKWVPLKGASLWRARTSWMLGLWTFYFPSWNVSLDVLMAPPRFKAFLGCHSFQWGLSGFSAHNRSLRTSLFSIPLKIFSSPSLFFKVEEFFF